MSTGTDKAWDLLLEREPSHVCRDALCRHDPERGCYTLVSMGMEFHLFPATRSMTGSGNEAGELHRRLGLYLEHCLVWYLASARGAGRTGRLVRPSSLRGGHHFFTQGTHVLPLDELASMYGSDAYAFMDRGLGLGGARADYADAAVELLPLPRVPVMLLLWLGDREYPARADLLFDSSADHQAPLDVLWAAAMLAVRAML